MNMAGSIMPSSQADELGFLFLLFLSSDLKLLQASKKRKVLQKKKKEGEGRAEKGCDKTYRNGSVGDDILKAKLWRDAGSLSFEISSVIGRSHWCTAAVDIVRAFIIQQTHIFLFYFMYVYIYILLFKRAFFLFFV